MRSWFALLRLAVSITCVAAAVFWVAERQPAFARNVAYVDLMRGLAANAEGKAEQFAAWAAQETQSAKPDPRATYGLALLTLRMAEENGTLLNPEVMSSLESLQSFPLQRDLLLNALAYRAHTSADVRAITAMLGEPQASRLLAESASEYWRAGDPTTALVFLEVFSEKGHPAGLTTVQAHELANVYAQLGWERRSANDWQGSLVWFDQALSLVPDNLMALVWKGYVLGELGDVATWGNLTRMAVELYPRESEAWRFWGTYLASQGESPEAEAALRHAVDLAPDSAWAHVNLAQVQLSVGSCREALPHAQVTGGGDPNLEASRLLVLGDVYWCLGERAAALQVYRQLVALQPTYCGRLKDRLSSCP